MNLFTLLMITAGIILASMFGSTFIRVTSRPFSNDPAGQSAVQGESARQQASRMAEDTAERQRHMMETMKSRIDRAR